MRRKALGTELAVSSNRLESVLSAASEVISNVPACVGDNCRIDHRSAGRGRSIIDHILCLQFLLTNVLSALNYGLISLQSIDSLQKCRIGDFPD